MGMGRREGGRERCCGYVCMCKTGQYKKGIGQYKKGIGQYKKGIGQYRIG